MSTQEPQSNAAGGASALTAGLGVWACFFPDGVPIFSTFAGSQKGSIRKARQALGVEKWKELKSRGIRCYAVSISIMESNNERIRLLKEEIMAWAKPVWTTPNVEFSGGAPLHGAASAGTKGYASGDKGDN